MNQSIPADSLLINSWESECIERAINELKKLPHLQFTIAINSANLNYDSGNKNRLNSKARKRKEKTDELERGENDVSNDLKHKLIKIKNDTAVCRKKNKTDFNDKPNDSTLKIVKTKNSELLEKLRKNVVHSNSTKTGTKINDKRFIEKLRFGKSDKYKHENLNHGKRFIENKMKNAAVSRLFDPP